MRFEWDAEKNRRNIHKHGIDFNDVPPMFQQPHLVHQDRRFDQKHCCR
ncbi:hypothetical protein F3J43_03020 [Pantoea sp. Cy-639]|nr:hypothetical protein [Pantoea sp. Cy-639]